MVPLEPARSLERWSTRDTLYLESAARSVDARQQPMPFSYRVQADIEGVQHGDGTVERSIYVDASAVELTSAQARRFALTLSAAADELDQLQ